VLQFRTEILSEGKAARFLRRSVFEVEQGRNSHNTTAQKALNSCATGRTLIKLELAPAVSSRVRQACDGTFAD
jgi:hypothetical protein